MGDMRTSKYRLPPYALVIAPRASSYRRLQSISRDRQKGMTLEQLGEDKGKKAKDKQATEVSVTCSYGVNVNQTLIHRSRSQTAESSQRITLGCWT